MAGLAGFRRRRTDVTDGVRSRLEPVLERTAPLHRPVLRAAKAAAAPVTPLGWTLVALGLVSWQFGVRLGWDEMLIVAGACLVMLVVSLLLTAGRLGFDIAVDVVPPRVVVGGDAVGRIVVTNPRDRPTLGGRIEVPVGRGIAVFDTGAIARHGGFEEPFVVPTNRRAVLTIGPARSVKGDPLGIARREVVSGEAVQLYVHPRTTGLPSIAAGWLRDLEGRTTNDLSTSDVAFHTLREYVPGDDRRHIHWRTTARLGTLMVRQFVDTRRSHLGLVLATRPEHWGSADEFELGVSTVGSLGRTAMLDDQEVSGLSGAGPIRAMTPTMFLDGLAGVELAEGASDLRELTLRATQSLRSASVVAIVVGSTVDATDLRRSGERFGKEVTVVAIRIVPDAVAVRRRIGNVVLLELSGLDDLARVLATGALR